MMITATMKAHHCNANYFLLIGIIESSKARRITITIAIAAVTIAIAQPTKLPLSVKKYIYVLTFFKSFLFQF